MRGLKQTAALVLAASTFGYQAGAQLTTSPPTQVQAPTLTTTQTNLGIWPVVGPGPRIAALQQSAPDILYETVIGYFGPGAAKTLGDGTKASVSVQGVSAGTGRSKPLLQPGTHVIVDLQGKFTDYILVECIAATNEPTMAVWQRGFSTYAAQTLLLTQLGNAASVRGLQSIYAVSPGPLEAGVNRLRVDFKIESAQKFLGSYVPLAGCRATQIHRKKS